MGGRGTTLSTHNLGAGTGGWSMPRPGRFAPGKHTRYPLHRKMCGLPGQCGRVRKIVLSEEFEYRTLQPLACRGMITFFFPMPPHVLSDFVDLWCVCVVRRVTPRTHTTGPNNHAAKHQLRTQKYHK